MKHKNELAVLLAACGWGMIGLFTRQLGDRGLGSGDILLVRACGCTIFFAVALAISGPSGFAIRLRDLPLLLAFGVTTLFFTYCYYRAIELASMSVACTLMFTAPVFVMVMSLFVFHERFSVQKLLSLGMALGGVTLVSGVVSGGATFSALGAIFGILSGFGYALYNIFSKLLSQRGCSVWHINFYGWFICTVLCVLIWGVRGAAPAVADAAGWSLCFWMVVVSGFTPALLYNWALRSMEASRASMMGTLEPVVATVVGALAFHEGIGLTGFLGIALVLAAVAVLNWKPRKEHNAAA